MNLEQDGIFEYTLGFVVEFNSVRELFNQTRLRKADKFSAPGQGISLFHGHVAALEAMA